MRLYAETNFILALAWEQEGWRDAAALVTLAATGRLELVLPAYSFLECEEALGRRGRERRTAARTLETEVTQLRRSSSMADLAAQAADTASRLVVSAEWLDERLAATRDQLLPIAAMVPLDAATIAAATALRLRSRIAGPDAAIAASVLADLPRPNEYCAFVSTDRRAFSDPGIRRLFRESGCTLLYSFRDARSFALSHIE
ncbi:MAG: hypothetical protein IT303_18995 [Dehalococcoidia bacterium]|nr:hypothetical protein [Dehalococcoidia bacterium]